MKTTVEIPDHEMPRGAVEARHYDDAWDAIQGDNPDLARVRQKLSVHEIRCVIRALIGPLLVLRIENQKLRALLDFLDEPVEGPLDGVYSQYRDRIEQLQAERDRLADGLHALAYPSDASNGVLRSVAYDIVMNGIDGETAVHQIQQRQLAVDAIGKGEQPWVRTG